MIFSFFHIWLATVEFRREKSSTWHVASNFIFRNDRYISNLDLYAAASTTTLQHYLDASQCTLPHSIFQDQHSAHLQSLNWFISGGTTRSCVRLPLARSTLFVNSPIFSSYSTSFQLPPSVRQATDMPNFRTLV